MSGYWESVEFRGDDRVGVKLIATEDGVMVNWGSNGRILTPTQARTIAGELIRAATEAEKCGAKDWIEP